MKQASMLREQRGFSIVGLIFFGLIIVALLLIAAKLVPAFTEYIAVERAVQKIKNEATTGRRSAPPSTGTR